MRLVFGKSKWEVPELSLSAYFERVKADGYDAAELYLPQCAESAVEIRTLLDANGLRLFAQMGTEGETPSEHLDSLERYTEFAAECGARLINSQTGRDHFSFEDNLRIFARSIELSRETGIPFANETHRSRPTFSAFDTRRFLEALPELRITADFSHWMVVHESDLSDQPENVAAAIERAIHTHARVGFEEGPQVNDPRAPEWAGHLENHLQLWRAIADVHRQRGAEEMTITPEFGPIPYMPTQPFTQQPVVDCWEVNRFMKEYLQEALGE